MKTTFGPRQRLAAGRLLACLLAGVLAAGCGWPMEPRQQHELTFRGQVLRAVTNAPVSGAGVEIWINPVQGGNSPPFVQGQTNAQGEFVLTRSVRSAGVRPDVIVRVTPPAGSALQAASFSGTAGDVFSSIETSGRKYTFSGQFLVQPGS